MVPFWGVKSFAEYLSYMTFWYNSTEWVLMDVIALIEKLKFRDICPPLSNGIFLGLHDTLNTST